MLFAASLKHQRNERAELPERVSLWDKETHGLILFPPQRRVKLCAAAAVQLQDTLLFTRVFSVVTTCP